MLYSSITKVYTKLIMLGKKEEKNDFMVEVGLLIGD